MAEAVPVPPRVDSVLVLVPEGAHTCRLVAFDSVKDASLYVDSHLVPGQSFHSFWALHPDDRRNHTGQGEALVMVRDGQSADLVQPYSFADCDGALSFIEQDLQPGREPGPALFFWVEPVSIPRGLNPPPVAVQASPIRQAPVPAVHPGHAPGSATDLAPTATDPGTAGPVSRLTAWPGWDGLAPLVMGAALWKQDTYYQVLDEDEYSGSRACLIVTFGAIAAALGAVEAGARAPAWHFVGAILGWSLAAAIIYGAARLFVPIGRPAGARGRLSIALGFAYSPALLLFLGAVPIFGPLLLLGVLMWIACTMVMATMTALELEMEPAIMLACAGWIPLFTLTLLVPTLIA
jgi:hypothetical protein